jgi:hypothetical protein
MDRNKVVRGWVKGCKRLWRQLREAKREAAILRAQIMSLVARRRVPGASREYVDATERFASRWVSVEDRLPTDSGAIWGYDGTDVFMCEFWGESGFQTYGASCDREGLNSERIFGVTHWAEIVSPRPPVSGVGKHGGRGK